MPELATALLRQEMCAVARLWLLLRHLDKQGAGRIRLKDARRQLTHSDSRWRICGKRQLRKLLRAGAGTFWARDKEYVWLRSTARVAAALGVGRFRLDAVPLPVALLTQPLATVRAHFYAAFHMSRDGEPISRATLCEVTGKSRATQRNYEQATGTRSRPNYALGPALTAAKREEWVAAHGAASFVLTDHNGQHGPPGRRYLARQLPNSYHASTVQSMRAQRRRLNRKLRDLSQIGTTGNTHRPRRYRCLGAPLPKRVETAPGYWQGTKNLWYKALHTDQAELD